LHGGRAAVVAEGQVANTPAGSGAIVAAYTKKSTMFLTNETKNCQACKQLKTDLPEPGEVFCEGVKRETPASASHFTPYAP
jgi:hypothetical protein